MTRDVDGNVLQVGDTVELVEANSNHFGLGLSNGSILTVVGLADDPRGMNLALQGATEPIISSRSRTQRPYRFSSHLFRVREAIQPNW
jgi:hypothetical protein